ncbi:MAG: hypothetical protein AAFP93_02820 [Bacteroidota bacterium]
MVWNIQRFNLGTIAVLPEGLSLENQITKAAYTDAKRNYILNSVKAVDPDIFIVVELQSRIGTLGSLVQGNGEAGALRLLNYLQFFSSSKWRLVPPLKLVGPIPVDSEHPYTEAIGVFFRSDKLTFQGPFVWPQDNPVDGNGKAALPAPIAGTPGDYPEPWKTVSGGTHYAGQYMFGNISPDGHQILGELLFNSVNNRRPFLTRFQERDEHGNNNGRIITIVTVHPSPNSETTSAVARVLSIPEIKENKSNEIIAVCGDLNVDSISGGPLEKSLFKLFAEDGYATNFGHSQGPTMLRTISDATPDEYKKTAGLDNIITRYGSDLHGDMPLNNAVVDGVNGQGIFDFQGMQNSVDFIKQNFAGDEVNAKTIFRKSKNYGKIGPNPGTSDHMAVVVDL